MALLFVMLWALARSQSNPLLDRLNITMFHRAASCMKGISEDTKDSLLANMCPHLVEGRNLCRQNGYLGMRMLYASWEQKAYCPVDPIEDYYQLTVTRLTKYSNMVYNISQGWRPLFDAKAESIRNSLQSHSICKLAADKWKRLSNEHFFIRQFRPQAIKCLNHLAAVRRGFHCAMCDSETTQYMNNTQPSFWGRRLWRLKKFTSITFTHETCLSFNRACLDFLDLKIATMEMANLQYTLALCDNEGVYFPPYRAWEAYKRVLPSFSYEFKGRLKGCKRHLARLVPEDGTPEKISDPVVLNKTENDCIALCEYEFSLSPLIFEDILNLNRVTAVYDMISLMLNTSPLTTTMFTSSTTPSLNGVEMDFSVAETTFFNFSRSNTTWGLSLVNHMKYTAFKKFDVSKFIQQSRLVPTVTFVIFILLILS